MSRYGAVVATFTDLMIAAVEESSRRDQREADIEHLFLALITTDYPAGHALRRAGVSLEDARQAVEDQHAHQLQLVGLDTGMPEPGRITAHETTGHQLTRRTEEILYPTGDDEITYTSQVLRRLLEEPSGFISEVLTRLKVSAAEILAELEQAVEAASPSVAATAQRGVLTGSSTTFVPASAEEIWQLVSDAERMPEWDQTLRTVKNLSDDEGVWEAVVREQLPNGERIKTKPKSQRRHIRRLLADEPHVIIWGISFPDAPQSNDLQHAITLTPAEAGTQLEVIVRWIQPTSRLSLRSKVGRAIVGRPLRPVMRYFVRMQAAEFTRSISRHFR